MFIYLFLFVALLFLLIDNFNQDHKVSSVVRYIFVIVIADLDYSAGNHVFLFITLDINQIFIIKTHDSYSLLFHILRFLNYRIWQHIRHMTKKMFDSTKDIILTIEH